MPMDRSLYPKDWEQKAFQVKEEANWTCQKCGKECYRPDAYPDGPERLDRRFVLTVHHKDHDPQNSDDDNLEALCAPCHLAEERRYRRQQARIGQMALPGFAMEGT